MSAEYLNTRHHLEVGLILHLGDQQIKHNHKYSFNR